jgi:hypothetical protein
VVAIATYVDATGKQMGNGGGWTIGISTIGMPSPMGAIMALRMLGGNLAMGMGVGMGSVGGDTGDSNMVHIAGFYLSLNSNNVHNGLYISP